MPPNPYRHGWVLGFVIVIFIMLVMFVGLCARLKEQRHSNPEAQTSGDPGCWDCVDGESDVPTG